MQGQEEGAGLRNLYIWGLSLKRMRRSPEEQQTPPTWSSSRALLPLLPCAQLFPKANMTQ